MSYVMDLPAPCKLLLFSQKHRGNECPLLFIANIYFAIRKNKQYYTSEIQNQPISIFVLVRIIDIEQMLLQQLFLKYSSSTVYELRHRKIGLYSIVQKTREY